MATQPSFIKDPSHVIDQGLTILCGPSPKDAATVDIIAVPGLGANPKTSFKSRHTNWDWLKEGLRKEFPTARVMLYEYESAWYGDRAIEQNLTNVANCLLVALTNKRVPGRPIVFIAHSMGGLVVAKGACIASARRDDYPQMYQCLSGCVFLGTPFKGSSSQAKGAILANVLKKLEKAVLSDMLTFLDPENKQLADLTKEFHRVAYDLEPKMKLYCFFEQQKTNFAKEKLNMDWLKICKPLNEVVVTEDSATLMGSDPIGLNCVHTELNRFNDSKDNRYDFVKGKLKEIIHKARAQVKARINGPGRPEIPGPKEGAWTYATAGRQSLVDDTTINKILDNLFVADEQKKLETVEKLNGSTSWVCDETMYKEWEDKYSYRSAEYLWICGRPGKGKSKAAVSAIKSLLDKDKSLLEKEVAGVGSRESPNLVAYFFCDLTADRISAESVLKSILRQLIWKRKNLARYAKEFAGSDTAKKDSPGTNKSYSVPNLWRALQNMLQDPSVETIYIVINNLHELNAASCQQLLDCMRSDLVPLTAIPDMENEDDTRSRLFIKGSIKWLILSRDRDHIRAALSQSKMRKIDLDAEQYSDQVEGDLKRRAAAKVGILGKKKGYNAALEYFVSSYIQKKAEDAVWIDMVCKQLEYLPVSCEYVLVRRTLEDMPIGVPALLDRICKTVLDPHTDGAEITKEILRSMMIAYEEPTMEELTILADIEVHGTEPSEFLLSHIQKCGSLLTVIDGSPIDGGPPSRLVAFIHSSAKTHLMERASDLLDMSEETKKWQHGIVALRSFSHVLDGLTPSYPLPEQKTLDEDTGEITPETQDAGGCCTDGNSMLGDDHTADLESPEMGNALVASVSENYKEGPDLSVITLPYPLKWWVHHAKDATTDIVTNLNLQHAFWKLSSEIRTKWWNNYKRNNPDYEDLEDVSSLHIAAIFGFLPLVNALLENGHAEEVHRLDSMNRQPLHWAAYEGHIDVVQELLKHGADVNDGQQDQRLTPLHLAAQSGHTEVMNELLSQNADVNCVAVNEGTPLYQAVIEGYDEAAKVLLKHDADSCIAENDFGTPLKAAALLGDIKTVKLLITHGAAIDINSSGSPLVVAATVGHVEVVKVLLSCDHDIESHQEALNCSAAQGHFEVASHLLAHTPQLELGNAFVLAASYGRKDDPKDEKLRKEMLSLLSNDRTIPQTFVDQALYHATDHEFKSTVELLLQDFKANPNAEGSEYGNALTAAAYDGTIDIISMLLNAGADINAPAGYALVAATSQDHTSVVKLLLENGADINACTTRNELGTALQAACIRENEEIVTLLLKKQADPNVYGGEYGYPLIAAAATCRNENIIKALVNAGARTDVQGGPDECMSTPLIYAAATHGPDILQFLIENGHAEVNTRDNDGDTALIVAAYCSDKSCVELLLRPQYNVDITLSGREKGTALHAAAFAGSAECCSLLLNHGASLKQQGGLYGSVLQAAAVSGKMACMEVVIDGSDVNVQGGLYGTALQAAAMQGDQECLKLLLTKGGEVNAVGGKHGTALQAACFADCGLNVKILISNGAEVNTVAGKHGTALQAAALKCEASTSDLLLRRKADVNAHCGFYGSALAAAAYANQKDTAELLLKRGADPSLSGKYGTALVTAAFADSVDVLDVLLNAGLEYPDIEMRTALEASARNRSMGALEKIYKTRWGQMESEDMIHSLEAQIVAPNETFEYSDDNSDSDALYDSQDEETDDDAGEETWSGSTYQQLPRAQYQVPTFIPAAESKFQSQTDVPGAFIQEHGEYGNEGYAEAEEPAEDDDPEERLADEERKEDEEKEEWGGDEDGEEKEVKTPGGDDNEDGTSGANEDKDEKRGFPYRRYIRRLKSGYMHFVDT